MWSMLKFTVYFAILATVGLIAFAYLGPVFGSDFSAPQAQVTFPVELDVD